MSDEKEDVYHFAQRLSNAYSTNSYTGGWLASVKMLRRRGFTDREIEAIIRSKWTRWAADASNKPHGYATSADLFRYLNDPKNGCAAGLAELVAQTFHWEEPEPSNAKPAPTATSTPLPLKTNTCPICAGYGVVTTTGMARDICPECHGSGHVSRPPLWERLAKIQERVRKLREDQRVLAVEDDDEQFAAIEAALGDVISEVRGER